MVFRDYTCLCCILINLRVYVSNPYSYRIEPFYALLTETDIVL